MPSSWSVLRRHCDSALYPRGQPKRSPRLRGIMSPSSCAAPSPSKATTRVGLVRGPSTEPACRRYVTIVNVSRLNVEPTPGVVAVMIMV